MTKTQEEKTVMGLAYATTTILLAVCAYFLQRQVGQQDQSNVLLQEINANQKVMMYQIERNKEDIKELKGKS